MKTNQSKQEICIEVKLMSPVHHDEVFEEHTVLCEVSENMTFGDLFLYLENELKLEDKGFYPVTIDNELAERIFNSTDGQINEDGQINWDYKLENQKILESFDRIGVNLQSFSVLCTGAIGSGGGIPIIDTLNNLITKYGPYLGSAMDLIELMRIIQSFLRFESKNEHANNQRIKRTIKKRPQWKFGFISKKKFVGKDIVEKQIMIELGYTKDEEKQEWIDRNMG